MIPRSTLLFDRFVRCADGTTLDLASGRRVHLRVTGTLSHNEQQWVAERGAALFRLRHPHLLRLVDYGSCGADHFFEAHAGPSPHLLWTRRDQHTAECLEAVVQFLHWAGVPPLTLEWQQVVQVNGRLALLVRAAPEDPLAGSGGVPDRADHPKGGTEAPSLAGLHRLLAGCRRAGWASNVEAEARQPADSAEPFGWTVRPNTVSEQVIEVLDDEQKTATRVVHLWGQPGSGRRTLLAHVAREARVRGYVPVSTAGVAAATRGSGPLSADVIRRLLRRRPLLIIHEHSSVPDTQANLLLLRLLLGTGAPSARATVVIVSHDSRPDRPGCLFLEPLAPRALVDSVETRVASRRRLGMAARCSAGNPGQFLRHVAAWPVRPPTVTAGQRDSPTAVQVAEARPRYGEQGDAISNEAAATALATGAAGTECRTQSRPAEVPASRNTLRLRQQIPDALALARRGRHAAAERLLRESGSALARRGDISSAARAVFELGRLLFGRGDLDGAMRAFTRAREELSRAHLLSASVQCGVYLGLCLTDADRLDQAEALLHSTQVAADQLGDVRSGVFARLGLVRCLLWQGHADEASDVLADARRVRAEQRLERHGSATVGRMQWATSTVHEPSLCDSGCGHSSMPQPDSVTEEGVSLEIMQACLEARVALVRRQLHEAGRWANRAVSWAQGPGMDHARSAAHRVVALVHAEIADVDGLRQHVAQGISAAALARLPLQALRLRVTLAEGLLRAGLECEGRRLVARLNRWHTRRITPLLRRRLTQLACAAGGANSAADVARQLQGMTAESRPGRPDGSARRRELDHRALPDILSLVELSHDAADESALLDRIVTWLQRRLRAISVTVFGRDRGVISALKTAGSRGASAGLAERAVDAALPIMNSQGPEGPQAAVPIRYANEAIGSIACRWSVGGGIAEAQVQPLLVAAAAVAAPCVRVLLDRLAAAPVPVLGDQPELLGSSAAMRTLRVAIERAAAVPFPVIIHGESGTGKELVARAIHLLGPRRGRKCCTLNCAAVPDDLIEAELFGHTRGAFTGAITDRAGLFEEADGGTLVLDEIAELSPRAQAKLLRVIQDGEVRRIGENLTRAVDTRVVAATNRSLDEEAAAGRFRRDLLYRLDVIRIVVPPLRDRSEDIPLLASCFWARTSTRLGTRSTLSPATLAALARYDWPGNVRELQNVVAALAVSAPRRGSVGPSLLPAALARQAVMASELSLDEARRQFDERYVRAALARTGGHRGRTARALGLSRQGLARLLARLAIDDTQSR